MNSPRQDILLGFQAAERVHRKINTREKFIQPSGRIDIYSIAADLGVPVMFRGLNGLLGAYLPNPVPGILITTNRPQGVQRLTCAHELGHYFLKHEQSFDDESMIGFSYAHPTAGNGIERQADAFAFSFLMPRWLIITNLEHLSKAGLTLPDAITVYQLSLRLGCSYMAMVYTLKNYNFISYSDLTKLQAIQPRTIKQSIVGDLNIDNWHRDVWVLTSNDDCASIDATPDDLFITKYKDSSTAGYITNTEELENMGFSLLKDHVFASPDSDDIVGSFQLHEVIISSNKIGKRSFHLHKSRPWDPPEKAHTLINIDVDIHNPTVGLSDEEKRNQLQELMLE